jgi:PncC family amidohydrolase
LKGGPDVNHHVTEIAQRILEGLRRRQMKIVFAESCTGGLVSAILARVPGISDVHCGSAVVYRLDTKSDWIDVSKERLVDPGPVSSVVAAAMATGVLNHTPEANIGVSVTGFLGPSAPEGEDGHVFTAIAQRGGECIVNEHRLAQLVATNVPLEWTSSERERRQWTAAVMVLELAANYIESINGN